MPLEDLEQHRGKLMNSYNKRTLLTAFSLFAGGLHTPSGLSSNNDDELEGIDIEEEYKLIQKKESQLSRRLRDRVCWLYEKQNKE